MDQIVTRLSQVIETDDKSDIQHSLLSLILDSHVQVNLDPKSKDASPGLILKVEQLDKVIDELFKQPLKQSVLNIQLSSQISQLYVSLLSHEPIQLFNSANKFITGLSTDDSKNLNNRLLSAIVLSAIYQSFGKDLTSFIPLLITTSLKQIKDNLTSHNTITLTYAVLLSIIVKLLYKLNLVNDHTSLLTDSQVSKYLKLIPKAKDNHEVQAKLYSIFGELTFFNYSHSDLAIYRKNHLPAITNGFKSPIQNVRVASAKTLAVTLQKFDFHHVVKFYHDIYHDIIITKEGDKEKKDNEDSSAIGIEVFQSIIDFVRIRSSVNPHDLNENIVDFFKELMLFLNHSHIDARLIDQLTFVVKTMTDSLSESSKVSTFDKFNGLLTYVDETCNEHQQILILKCMDTLLEDSLNLDVEKYQILLIKLALSLSSSENIRVKAIHTLIRLISIFPIVLKDLLENFFNELSNNSNNSDIFKKNFGLSLLISKLIKISTEDYVSRELIDQIWKFAFNYIKANQGTNDDFLVCAWILVSGVFSYYDELYLSSLIDDFKLIWTSGTDRGFSHELIEHQLNALDELLVHVDELDSGSINLFIDTVLKIRLQMKEKKPPSLDSKTFKIFHMFVERFNQQSTSSILIQAIYNLMEYNQELSSQFIEFQRSKVNLNWLTDFNLQHNHCSDSVTDSSMGIFIKNFALVSDKIQLSLIEIMRNFILAPSATLKDKRSITINISIAINGALKSQKFTVQDQIKVNLLDTLYLLYETYPIDELLLINAESIGLLISKTMTNTDEVPVIISKIVNNDDSNLRCFNALILSNIYKYNHNSKHKIHFQEIYSVLLTLIKDPNPNVHYFALIALRSLIENHVVLNLNHGMELIKTLEYSLLSDKFGRFNESSNSSNLNLPHGSNLMIAKFLRTLVINLGFNLKDLDAEYKSVLKNVILANFYDPIGSEVQLNTLRILNELVIFDPDLLPLQLILRYMKTLMINNMINYRLGSGAMFQLNVQLQGDLQPLDVSNLEILKYCFKLLLNLMKIHEGFQITAFENLLWIGLELYPDEEELVGIVTDLISLSTNFNTLINKFILNFQRPRFKMLESYLNFEKLVVNKYSTKSNNTNEIKDEESQSINREASVVASDPINWKFKLILVNSTISILKVASNDTHVLATISTKIEELIKISFNASTSKNLQLKSDGIKLLSVILMKYSDFKDPIYPQFSLLQQQQAQIISAIIPAFQDGSTAMIAGYAIQVIGKFIGSNITKPSKLERLVSILTSSLNGIVDYQQGDKINDIPITSVKSFKTFQIDILNSWADLAISNYEKEERDEELNHLITSNLSRLLPLWISVLKEATVANLREDAKHVELIELINIVRVIGTLIKEDASLTEDLLNGDVLGFYYMLYADCLFLVTSHHNENEQVLKAILSLLNSSDLINLIYNDEHIFHETYEILKRLVLVNKDKEIVIDIVAQFFDEISKTGGNEINEHLIEKLFELIELVFIPLNTNDNSALISKVLNRIIDDMICKLPDFLMLDLMLLSFRVTMKYLDNSFSLAVLKKILIKFKEYEQYDIINKIYSKITFRNNINSLLLFTVFLNIMKAKLIISNPNEIVEIVKFNLEDSENIQLTIQSIKSIILNCSSNTIPIITSISQHFLLHHNKENFKIFIELYILIIKTYCDKLPLYQAIVPVLIQLSEDEENVEYTQTKLNYIISLNQDYFKAIVREGLTESQKGKIMNILQS